MAMALTTAWAPGDPIRGLVAPVFTPINRDGGLDLDKVDSQARWLNASGVEWVFTSGSTGESVDLTVAERKSLAVKWIQVSKLYGQHVIVHVGSDSVNDAQDMAAHAQQHSADAIAAMPPTYIRPGSPEALVQTVAAIASAAPSTPFYYYHIPMKTGVAFPMADLVLAADSRIPTFRGVKFTDEHLDDMQIAMSRNFTAGAAWRRGRAPDVLYGRDQWLLGATAFGIHGAVGTTYNFNAELQRKVLGGDGATARRAQLGTSTFIRAISDFEAAFPGVYSWKLAMELMGMDVGPARLPFVQPTQAARDALRSALARWCKATDTDIQPGWCGVLRFA